VTGTLGLARLNGVNLLIISHLIQIFKILYTLFIDISDNFQHATLSKFIKFLIIVKPLQSRSHLCIIPKLTRLIPAHRIHLNLQKFSRCHPKVKHFWCPQGWLQGWGGLSSRGQKENQIPTTQTSFGWGFWFWQCVNSSGWVEICLI